MDYGNHSIPFKNREIANRKAVIESLNTMHFEKSEFLFEMCKQWHLPAG